MASGAGSVSLADVLQVASSLAVVASVLVLAWQSKQLANASSLASQTAIAGATSDAATNMRAVFEALLAYPELRPYISDGEPLPAARRLHDQALTLCEMLCDAAEASLEVAAQVPGAIGALSGWPDWAAWVLEGSPGSVEHVLAHPSWYPRLAAIHHNTLAGEQP
jgi:hypothetical protein